MTVMIKLTIAQYLKRNDAYPISATTVRKYIDVGILQGEKIDHGTKATYYVHIVNGDDNPDDDYFQTIIKG